VAKITMQKNTMALRECGSVNIIFPVLWLVYNGNVVWCWRKRNP